MAFCIQNYFAVIVVISVVLYVVVFDLSYAVVFPVFDFEFGQSGTGNGDFKTPEDVVFHANNIYVADTSNHRIQKFDSTDRETGDVVIQLTNDASADGYTAYTTAIADESNHQMLKAKITVYDIDRLSDVDLSTIVRHEMGHALGLAHSTAPEDLMHPVIGTDYPYISECDLDAIVSLYDGSQNSQVICEK
ncbi:matrixin family metalloprotease [Nitrosopumilus sp.]|uniref:matrixin family metalloprotease n=1 Tax=Nitrosopumilus sp. TaxID=2024843 RepID=UPI00247EEE6C|nr:matrixin family metalloprotease [Nitrosopumilus sp.]MCV0409474.1 matrixin family metalloprotease [Nitrosopumilus sp.]